MKVIEGSAGLLTNFETMALLKSRGANRGIGVAGGLTAAEIKVYDYLERTPAGSQSRESLGSFLKAAEQFKFTKAECLQASNLRPASAVEVHLIVEDCDERMTTDAVDQFLATVEDTLPPPPEPLEDIEGQGDTDQAEADAEGDEMEEGDEDVPAE